jgi:Tfp pilus assembly protein PilN
VWKERTIQQLQKQRAQLQQEMAEAAKPIEQFKQMQDKQRTLAQQAELTASLLERVPRSYLLAEITNGIPSGVSLLDFDMASRLRQGNSSPRPNNNSAAPAAPTTPVMSQARVYDVVMRLTGIASTDVQVAQFITKLNHSDLLKDVNLVISDEFKQGNETLRKFQIEMSLNPEAQVSLDDIKKKTDTAAAPLEN